MSQLQIYNTLTKQKEIFKPIKSNQVGLYVCGNTVYDYCHVGNARVFVFFDVVARYLNYLNYKVNFVRNITDIDDKIINRAKETKQNYQEVTSKFIQALHEDLQQLNINSPTFEPKVTDHIQEIIDMIKILLDKGYAYIGENGDVYYETNKFKKYGELAQQNLDKLRAGARVEISSAKRDPLDFVLWKMAKPDEPSWQSPWGLGRPGWHIECSAMAERYLGKHFDMHGGGADLQFPHHQNEVAQAEAAYDCKFVNYWLHVGFVSVNHQKMSKSLGNFFTVREVLNYYRPEVLRYFLLAAHYRSPLNYSTEQLDMAQASLTTLYTALRGLNLAKDSPIKTANLSNLSKSPTTAQLSQIILKAILPPKTSTTYDKFWQNFQNAMNDDFNIPLALSQLFNVAHFINKQRETNNIEAATEAAKILRNMGNILGILQHDPESFFQSGATSSDENKIQSLIDARLKARENKDWAYADQLRDQLKEMGIVLEDTPKGTTWKKR